MHVGLFTLLKSSYFMCHFHALSAEFGWSGWIRKSSENRSDAWTVESKCMCFHLSHVSITKIPFLISIACLGKARRMKTNSTVFYSNGVSPLLSLCEVYMFYISFLFFYASSYNPLPPQNSVAMWFRSRLTNSYQFYCSFQLADMLPFYWQAFYILPFPFYPLSFP